MYFSQQQQKLGKTGQVSMKLDFRFYHFMEKKNNLNHIKKFRLTIFRGTQRMHLNGHFEIQ